MTSAIHESLRGIFQTRVALNVTKAFCAIGIHIPCALKGKSIPATFATDLRHAAPSQVKRFEVWLKSHGATLVQ